MKNAYLHLVVFGTLSTCLSAVAAQPGPRISIAPAQPGLERGETAAVKPWNEAETVFTGLLQSVQAGPVGQSFPPVYTHTLQIRVERVLRGTLKPGQQISASHVARQHQEPTFPAGKVCLIAASSARDVLRIERIELGDPQNIAAAELACSLPLGWRVVDDKPVSPWVDLPSDGWKDAGSEPKPLRCSRTGRPALMAGPGIRFSVEPVPPAKEIKWTNPDGDGEYKITVTNTSEQPLRVPALMTDGERILWEESLVILCQDKAYPCPGAVGVVQPPKPVELQPGQSVSTVVNALRLEGPEWPRGGYRIEFQFCLGELSQTESFYYLSRHHDGIRAALKK